MNRAGRVFIQNRFGGRITETDQGYTFVYDPEYLKDESAKPVSLTMPLRGESYFAKTLFPFFDGLIPEGWLLHLVIRNWKLQTTDRFGLLLVSCRDCIGDVHVLPEDEA